MKCWNSPRMIPPSWLNKMFIGNHEIGDILHIQLLNCLQWCTVCLTVSQLGLSMEQEKECQGQAYTNHTETEPGRGQQVMAWESKRVLTWLCGEGGNAAKKAGVRMSDTVNSNNKRGEGIKIGRLLFCLDFWMSLCYTWQLRAEHCLCWLYFCFSFIRSLSLLFTAGT